MTAQDNWNAHKLAQESWNYTFTWLNCMCNTQWLHVCFYCIEKSEYSNKSAAERASGYCFQYSVRNRSLKNFPQWLLAKQFNVINSYTYLQNLSNSTVKTSSFWFYSLFTFERITSVISQPRVNELLPFDICQLVNRFGS